MLKVDRGQTIEDIFVAFDLDGGGTIDPDELRDGIVRGLQRLSRTEITEESEEEQNNLIDDELEDFKLSHNSENELQSNTSSGFQDVDEGIIKSEDM